jgi:hypothetical protein
MPDVLQNSHRHQFALRWESPPGEILANAAAYASDEGTDTHRYFVEPFDTSFVLGPAAVPNADQQPRVGHALPPHKGLDTADGGSITMRLWGSGATFSTGVTKTQSANGRLLAHCLGGSSLGSDATITTVSSQTVFEVDDIGDTAVGQIIWFEDADDAGRLFPARVTVVADPAITIDRVMPFTVAIGDKIYGSETIYYDQAALTNPSDANYTTVTIISCKGDRAWLAAGGHLALESIAVERGQQPKLSIPVLAAKGYPPGSTGGITVPTFTGTIQGLTDVRPIGRDTKCRLTTFGATTESQTSLFSAAIQVGCPVLAQDGVTESVAGMPGRIGYRTEPAETLITLVVPFSTDYNTWWLAGTLLTCTYWQTDSVGKSWAVDIKKCFLNAPPKVMHADANKHEIVLRATDITTGSTELANSKIALSLA